MSIDVHPGWYTVHYWIGTALSHRKFDNYADAVAFDQEVNSDDEDRSLPQAVNGECVVCGESDFTLAREVTQYTKLLWSEESQSFELGIGGLHDDAPPRMFCSQCNTYHQVPEDLE